MREPDELIVALADEAATRAAGAALARALERSGSDGVLVTLAGELGSGKTTLVRGLLEAMGVAGPVRSPTFTLLESYAIGSLTIDHLDWYRLGAGDLDSIGFRDLLAAGHWVLVEWPERAPLAAARADVQLRLEYAAVGRQLGVHAGSGHGRAAVAAWRRAIG